MKHLALAAVACALLCCGPKPNPNPPPSGGDFCAAAQSKLLELQCKDEGRLLGGPTKRGVPFEAFCKEKIEQGIMTQQDAMCLSKITDCAQVDAVCSWGG